MLRPLSILLLLATNWCWAQNYVSVPVSQCGGDGQLHQVRITDCTTQPCLLKKGKTASLQIDYTPRNNVQAVKTGAWGHLQGSKLPFIGTNGKSACDKIVTTRSGQPAGCQLTAGEFYTYTNSFPIRQLYPAVGVNVQWELIDETTNQPIVCFLLPAKIV